MQNNFQLPKGWEIKKLGEVCEIIAGQSPESKFYNDKGKGLPFYQGKKEFTEKYIGKPTKWTTKTTKEAIKNDILMSVRAPVGPVNFSTQRICIGRGLAIIRCKKIVDKEFVFKFLKKYEEEITGNVGAVFNSINKKQIETIQIPIPPLPEQKRIVKILNKAFEAIDKAKANAEQNLKNIKEVFESYLNMIFEEKGKDWEEKKFSECLEKIIYSRKIKRKDFFKNGDYPIISQEQELINGYWNNIDDLFKIKKPVVIFGDHTKVIKFINFDFVLGADGVKVLQSKSFVDSKYMYYYLRNVDLGDLGYARHYRLLKDIYIYFPRSKEEQKQIV